jgi:hypothetical protein
MKPKYKVGDIVYTLEDKCFIAEGENPIKQSKIISWTSNTYCKSVDPEGVIKRECITYYQSIINSEVRELEERELTTNKQDLINKVKDIIIEMESNIEKVKSELGIK